MGPVTWLLRWVLPSCWMALSALQGSSMVRWTLRLTVGGQFTSQAVWGAQCRGERAGQVTQSLHITAAQGEAEKPLSCPQQHIVVCFRTGRGKVYRPLPPPLVLGGQRGMQADACGGGVADDGDKLAAGHEGVPLTYYRQAGIQ